MMRGLAFAAVLFPIVAGPSAHAEKPAALRLPAILSDNMVLQAGKPCRIWGWAPPSETVTVTLAGQTRSDVADASGRWEVLLNPLQPGGPFDMTVTGPQTLVVRNILAGEVWLCAGQSNMQFALQEAEGGSEAIRQAGEGKIRFFTTGFLAPAMPQDDVKGRWVECSPETVRTFSAVGYFAGRMLFERLRVPIGLIHSSQGATAAESWTPLPALEADPSFVNIVQRHRTMARDPWGWDMHLPSGLYNGRIAPLAPFTIRGVFWYQGETNAPRAFQYRSLFPAMIRAWRAAWGEELPFYFVQLAAFQKARPDPADEPWAELREAQAAALALPHTAMVSALDLGEATDIHPKKKREVGERLARAALAGTYGHNEEWSGPSFRKMEKEGAAVRLHFDHTSGGLDAGGRSPGGFSIAGTDRRFVWADAHIEADTVIVSSPEIPDPVAVRYAWANNPDRANLRNGKGLPAVPFRTDTWPGVTDTAHILSPEELARKPEIPAPLPPVPDSVAMTGNTLEVVLGESLKPTWDEVKVNGYASLPRQAVKGNETVVYLPYGDRRGLYYALEGMKVTPVAFDAPPRLTLDSAAGGFLTFALRFDKPIGGFALKVGPCRFLPGGGVLRMDFSVDGKKWQTLRELDQGGDLNLLCDPAKCRAGGLDTRTLFLRCSIAPKDGAPALRNASLAIRMAGDVRWGDASRTFAESQWQVRVTPR